MPGDLTNIFGTGSTPASYTKTNRVDALGGIFNDNEEFKKRQEEDRKRMEAERVQREAEQQRSERSIKEKIVDKVKNEVKMIKPTLKELPGVVKEAAPEFIKGAELGALQLATTGYRTLSRLASTDAAKNLGISKKVVDRLDAYAKNDRASLEILQKEYSEGDPETKKLANLNYLTRGVGQTITTMVPAIGAGIAASILAVPTAVASTVGAATMAPLIFGEAWEQSKKAGKSDEEADLRASVTTVVIGALERIGLGKILKPSTAPTIVKRIISRMGESVPTEVLTENIQEFAEVAIGKTFGEDKKFKDALQSIPEVTVQTVLATMAFSGALGSTQRRIEGPNGMVLEEQAPEEIPFNPEAAALAPTIEETRQIIEQSLPEPQDAPQQEVSNEELLKTVIEQYDTPEAFIAAVQKGEIPQEYLAGLETNEDLNFQEARKYKSAEQFVKGHKEIFRYSRNEKQMGKSKFFGESKDAVADFGTYEGAKLETALINDSKLYKGGSSYGYLQDNGLFDKPNKIIRDLTNGKLNTPSELDDALSYDSPLYEKIKGTLADKNPNVIYSATQQIAAEDLARKGFKGAKWSYEDDLIPVQYQVWDDSFIQTKSQLTDIYNQANDQTAKLTEIYNNAKKPTVKNEVKDTVAKDTVLEEMMQSVPGARFMNESTGEYSGSKSTFPQWVPEDLRSTALFNQVISDISEGNLPRGETKRAELYQIVRNEINKRSGSPEVDLEGVLLKKGEGKKERLQSRVFERLQQENPEALEGDLEYSKMNMKKDAEKAVNLVASDVQKAYDIAMGNETSTDITSTAASIALSEKALVEGNHELYERLTRNRSLAQTRRGQEIVSEKGSITDNSTARYVKELISAKLDALGNKYLDTIRVGKKSTPKQRALKAMDAEIKKAEKYVKSEKLTMKDAISLLDQLTCI